MKNFVIIFSAIICIIILASTVSRKAPQKVLPDHFVYLRDVDRTLIEVPRYFSFDNFIGRPITGYILPNLIGTKKMAEQLKAVNDFLKNEGFQLVVYDAYRPQRAVDDFVSWSKDLSDLKMKPYYYPYLEKKQIFEEGYVAERSGHSRGSTVDLTIIKLGESIQPILHKTVVLTNGENIVYLHDGSVDMGSSFDLFHPSSHHDSTLVPEEAQKMRNYLREVMKQFGFKEYQYEWWHYTLVDEPFPHDYFDFIPNINKTSYEQPKKIIQ